MRNPSKKNIAKYIYDISENKIDDIEDERRNIPYVFRIKAHKFSTKINNRTEKQIKNSKFRDPCELFQFFFKEKLRDRYITEK